MKFLNLSQKLDQRRQAKLERQLQTVQSPQSAELTLDNKTLVNFCGNDYLGLANSPQAKTALTEAVGSYGFGSGASHLICGHQQPHELLEKALADFLQRDAALCFGSGYSANLAILSCLAQKGDLIIADKLNHASLIDGVRLSSADGQRYAHCDLPALQRRLKTAPQNKFVVTDSVFSMDGDVAPLAEIAALCEKYQAILVVDDAHGFGVLGKAGRGSAEAFGLDQKQLPVLMTTLGKSLGGYGACVTGEVALVEYLRQMARPYIYTTAMPAAVAAANLANLQLLQADTTGAAIVARLQQNIQFFRKAAAEAGVTLLPSETAIQPLLVGDNDKVMQLSHILSEQGFWVGAIRPPTVPANSARLRITLSAAHSLQQIESLVAALAVALQTIKLQ